MTTQGDLGHRASAGNKPTSTPEEVNSAPRGVQLDHGPAGSALIPAPPKPPPTIPFPAPWRCLEGMGFPAMSQYEGLNALFDIKTRYVGAIGEVEEMLKGRRTYFAGLQGLPSRKSGDVPEQGLA